jgi:hypothetical protein
VSGIVVLYEDSPLGVPRKGFGPHDLLLACVADRLSVGGYWQLRNCIDGRPCKGDSKLLQQCLVAPSIGVQGGPVVAVFDQDKAHRLLALPPTTSVSGLTRGVLATASYPPNLAVTFLAMNTETLVAAAASSLGLATPAKSPKDRDDVLLKCANTQQVSVRRSVEKQMPSFCDLVEGVLRLWSQASSCR